MSCVVKGRVCLAGEGRGLVGKETWCFTQTSTLVKATQNMEQALTAAVMPPQPHGECEGMHYLLSHSQLVQLLEVRA